MTILYEDKIKHVLTTTLDCGKLLENFMKKCQDRIFQLTQAKFRQFQQLLEMIKRGLTNYMMTVKFALEMASGVARTSVMLL